jgi:hypothetical protein
VFQLKLPEMISEGVEQFYTELKRTRVMLGCGYWKIKWKKMEGFPSEV